MPGPLDNHEIRKLLLRFPGKAIKHLWHQHHKGLVKIAFNLTHDEDAAKDIVQDTFSQIWVNARQLGNYRGRSIEHYLARIVRNKSMTYYNEQVLLSKRRIRFADDLNLSEQSGEARVIEVEVTQEILSVVALFPRRERQCLILKLEEDLSNAEISERLGVGVKAVERSLTSAKKRLRKELWLRFNKKV